MIFTPCRLQGAFLIDPQRHEDPRGSFARVWCRREYQAHGLDDNLVQANVSVNRAAGTLRGMHYQLPPTAETKVVQCVRGRMVDVIVDIRPQSPTFLQWLSVELSPANGRMLYVPKGFAHGFQTLQADTDVLYFMSDYHAPEQARGFRWNDARVSIDWAGIAPGAPGPTMSDRDRDYPDLRLEELEPFRTEGRAGR